MSKASLIASCTAAAALAIALPGLFLAGPAIADDRPTDRPPVTYIDAGTLAIDSDFTVFMGKGVPEDVRRVALRRLWVLMELPVSCYELCYEPHPETKLSHLASQGPQSPLGNRGDSFGRIAGSAGSGD
jgi:uncharacterized protein DUF3306